MAVVYSRAVGAVWRRIGGRCIIQLDATDHTIEGGAAVIWVALETASSAESLQEMLDVGGTGPTRAQLDDAVRVLCSHGLVTAS